MRTFLIVGFGSIGRRHATNLLALKAGRLTVYDTDPARCRQAQVTCGAAVFASLEEALDNGPDVVLVTTPTSCHLPPALAAAERGCHLFIEKPLSDSLDGVEPLLRVLDAKALISLVGCNLRFHHGPSTIKRLLEEGVAGRPISAQLDFGQYLPDWHPTEDYRQGYSARRALGGGIILDGIHELDYARWLLGPVRRVVAMGGHLSALEIDTEDCAEILLEFQAGPLAHIHLDYIQRAYGRTCKVIGEGGTIWWDLSAGAVRWFSAQDRRWREEPAPPDYDADEMYVAELRHFLRCLDGRETPVQDVRAGKEILQVAVAAKEALETGQPVEMEQLPAPAAVKPAGRRPRFSDRTRETV